LKVGLGDESLHPNSSVLRGNLGVYKKKDEKLYNMEQYLASK